MKKENVVFVIIFYYTMCIIGLWFASLSAFVAISLQFIRASCEKYLKWLESNGIVKLLWRHAHGTSARAKLAGILHRITMDMQNANEWVTLINFLNYAQHTQCVHCTALFFLGLSLFFSFLRSESFITFWYSQLKSTETKHTCGARCTFSLILYLFWIVSTAASISRIGEYGNKWREKHIYTFRSWQNAMKQTARVKFMLQNELRSTTCMQTKSSQAIKKAQEFNSARFYSQLLLLSYVIIIILW